MFVGFSLVEWSRECCGDAMRKLESQGTSHGLGALTPPPPAPPMLGDEAERELGEHELELARELELREPY